MVSIQGKYFRIEQNISLPSFLSAGGLISSEQSERDNLIFFSFDTKTRFLGGGTRVAKREAVFYLFARLITRGCDSIVSIDIFPFVPFYILIRIFMLRVFRVNNIVFRFTYVSCFDKNFKKITEQRKVDFCFPL